MDGPFWGLIAQWGPGGGVFALAIAGGWAILSGRLISRRTHLDRVTDLKERIIQIGEERDSWRQAHETSEGTRRILAEQVEKLITMGTVTNQMLTSLKSEAKE
jgi:hypothetical protein